MGRPRSLVTLEDLRRIARRRGGDCISPVYIADAYKHRWRCAAGHEWKATPNNIKRDRWCPTCAREERRSKPTGDPDALAPLREAARRRGGTLVSRRYRTTTDKVRWRCAIGHEWDAAWASVRKGTWCIRCAGHERLTLEDLREVARERGGQCLATEYVNNTTLIPWRCTRGHVWSASTVNVKAGTWCPDCGRPRADTIESVKRIARVRGGECLSREYVDARTPLLWQCRQGHRWETSLDTIKSGGWCALCYEGGPPPDIDEMNAYAAAKGGECLSMTYVNDGTRLEWRCAKGHRWKAKPNAIKAGAWCQRCARAALHGSKRPVYSLADMGTFAAKHGGRCLSSAYAGAHSPLEWECAEGHVWQTPPHLIRRGSWCPECDRLRRIRRDAYAVPRGPLAPPPGPASPDAEQRRKRRKPVPVEVLRELVRDERRRRVSSGRRPRPARRG